MLKCSQCDLANLIELALAFLSCLDLSDQARDSCASYGSPIAGAKIGEPSPLLHYPTHL